MEKNHLWEEITIYILTDKADLLFHAFKKAKLKGNIECRQKKCLCHPANF